MSDWITADRASKVTGVDSISDSDLDAAEIDVFDLLRWNPVYGVDLNSGSDLHLRQADALGRAIAWQAAYRIQNPPQPFEAVYQSESVGAWSGTLAEGQGPPPINPPRVRKLVSDAGLMRMTGSSGRGSTRSPQMIPVDW